MTELRYLAEKISEEAGSGVDLVVPRDNQGIGVSVLDSKDAKYLFGVEKADAEMAIDPVKSLLEKTLPQTLSSGLGYGLVLGAPPDVEAKRRYVAFSLDIETRQQIMLERAAICNILGVSAIGYLSPHVSMLSVRGDYSKAEEVAELLEERVVKLDQVIDGDDGSGFKLDLGPPKLNEMIVLKRPS